jgi:hypothetical protein
MSDALMAFFIVMTLLTIAYAVVTNIDPPSSGMGA